MSWGRGKGGWSREGDEPRRLATRDLHVTIQGFHEIIPGGFIRNRQKTAYDAGTGVWIGIDADANPKFGVGDTTNYLKWDPTNGLVVAGDGGGLTSIDGGNIQTGTVTADAIAAGAITATEIAAETIIASNIAADAIGTSELQAGSVTATEINVTTLSAIAADMGTLTAGEIVIGSTDKLWLNDTADGALNIGGSTKASAPFQVTAAGALTATNATITGAITATSGSFIGDGSGLTSLDGGNIQTGTITATEIAAGAITASNIQVGTLTFDRLVTGFMSDNLVQDAGFESANLNTIHDFSSTGGGTWSIESTHARGGTYGVQYNPSGMTSTAHAYLNGDPTATDYLNRHVAALEARKYTFETWAYRAAATTANRVRLYTHWYDASGSIVSSNYTTFDPSTWTDDTWTQLTSTKTAPAGVAYVVWDIAILNDGNAGLLYFDDILARAQIGADYIEANAITANHIAAGTITATELNVSTLSAIAADLGTITAGTINMYTGTWDTDATGFRINATEIAGQNAGTDQVLISSSDGKLTAGGGNITIDASGITGAISGQDFITINEHGIIFDGTIESETALTFTNNDDSIQGKLLASMSDSSSPDYAEIEIDVDTAGASTDRQFMVYVGATGKRASFNLRSWDSSSALYIEQRIISTSANGDADFRFTHIPTATPTTGLGVALNGYVKDSSGSATKAGALRIEWDSPTSATRKGRLILEATDYNADREIMRGLADGSQAKLGFFGVTPVARPSSYTWTNGTTDRVIDANATTLSELADVVYTMWSDLKDLGLLQ